MEHARKLEVAIQFRQLAELNFQEQNLSDSCFYYINCLKFAPEWKNELRNRFILILSYFGQSLEKQEKYTEIFTVYEEALKLYSDSEVINHNLGAHLLRLGYPDKAAFYFKEALKYNDTYFPAYRSLHSAHCALVERWHYRMLNDSFRNNSYRNAITRKIQQGFDTVLDIGTGTGLFCLYALEAGAKCIYGCDMNPTMVLIAEKVFQENGISEKIKIVDKNSNNIKIPGDIPERVSLVVTETMDSGLLGEHMLQSLAYAWKHLLLPPSPNFSIGNSASSGVVIPHSGSFCFCAVESRVLARKYIFPLTDISTEECLDALANITLKDSVPENFQNLKYNNIELYADLNEPYDTERLQLLPDCTSLTEPRESFYINFNHPELIEKCLYDDTRQIFEVTSTKRAYFHAIAAWFNVYLDEVSSLSSAPSDHNAKNCCWDQAIFPCSKAFHVLPGSRILISSDWIQGKVLLNVQQVTQPDGSVAMNSAPLRASVKHVSMLNDTNLIEQLTDAAVKFINKFRGDNKLHIMDLFPVPIFGLTVLRNAHLLNNKINEIKLVCSITNHDDSAIIRKIAESNRIPNDQILFLMEKYFEEEMIQFPEQESFDVIMMNPLDYEGDLNEEVVNRVHSLNSLLKKDGLLLPRKIEICSQLVYSDYIEENMRIVNDDINRCRIGPAINEFQVSQMVEMNLSLLKLEKYSSTFACHEFLAENIKEEFSKEFFVSVARSGTINSVPYWYNIYFFNDDKNYCSLGEFSYVHQAAFLLKSPVTFHENDMAIVQFVYHYGTFIINLKNCSI